MDWFGTMQAAPCQAKLNDGATEYVDTTSGSGGPHNGAL